MQQLAFQSQHKIEFVQLKLFLFLRKDKLSRSSEMQWQWNGLLVMRKLARCWTWWTRIVNIQATNFLLALLCDIHICNLCICWIWTGASINKSHIKSSTKSFFMVLHPILACIYRLFISISLSLDWTHTDLQKKSFSKLRDDISPSPCYHVLLDLGK